MQHNVVTIAVDHSLHIEPDIAIPTLRWTGNDVGFQWKDRLKKPFLRIPSAFRRVPQLTAGTMMGLLKKK